MTTCAMIANTIDAMVTVIPLSWAREKNDAPSKEKLESAGPASR